MLRPCNKCRLCSRWTSWLVVAGSTGSAPCNHEDSAGEADIKKWLRNDAESAGSSWQIPQSHSHTAAQLFMACFEYLGEATLFICIDTKRSERDVRPVLEAAARHCCSTAVPHSHAAVNAWIWPLPCLSLCACVTSSHKCSELHFHVSHGFCWLWLTRVSWMKWSQCVACLFRPVEDFLQTKFSLKCLHRAPPDSNMIGRSFRCDLI